jgi:hypothetical protein
MIIAIAEKLLRSAFDHNGSSLMINPIFDSGQL